MGLATLVALLVASSGCADATGTPFDEEVGPPELPMNRTSQEIQGGSVDKSTPYAVGLRRQRGGG